MELEEKGFDDPMVKVKVDDVESDGSYGLWTERLVPLKDMREK